MTAPRVLLFALLLFALPIGWILLAADRDAPGDDVPADRPTGDAPAPNTAADAPDRVAIAAVPDPAFPPTLLAADTTDLTGDGAADRIELRVDAVRDDRGRMQWDDGHRWTLHAKIDGSVYPLFDERVQIGQVRFWVVDRSGMGAGEGVAIVLLREAGAGVELRSYRWRESGGFEARTEFTTAGNVVYGSPEIP